MQKTEGKASKARAQNLRINPTIEVSDGKQRWRKDAAGAGTLQILCSMVKREVEAAIKTSGWPALRSRSWLKHGRIARRRSKRGNPSCHAFAAVAAALFVVSSDPEAPRHLRLQIRLRGPPAPQGLWAPKKTLESPPSLPSVSQPETKMRIATDASG